jgi:DNA-binding transcriptional regulator GbsR (MarR family)
VRKAGFRNSTQAFESQKQKLIDFNNRCIKDILDSMEEDRKSIAKNTSIRTSNLQKRQQIRQEIDQLYEDITSKQNRLYHLMEKHRRIQSLTLPDLKRITSGEIYG